MNAFVINKPEQVKGKNILLVDDVYTTGSTAKECTRTLLKAGTNQGRNFLGIRKRLLAGCWF